MSMNTITLDNGIYNSVAAYARLHNMSVSEAVKTGMQVFLEIIGKNNVAASRPKYYINPKVKALEMESHYFTYYNFRTCESSIKSRLEKVENLIFVFVTY